LLGYYKLFLKGKTMLKSKRKPIVLAIITLLVMLAMLTPSYGGVKKTLAATETGTFSCTVDLFGGGPMDCHGNSTADWDQCTIVSFVGDQITFSCTRTVADAPAPEVSDTVLKATFPFNDGMADWTLRHSGDETFLVRGEGSGKTQTFLVTGDVGNLTLVCKDNWTDPGVQGGLPQNNPDC